MNVRAHPNARAFLERARPFLLRHEAEYNLILGITGLLAAQGELASPALLITMESDGAVVGCAMRTPPQKLVITQMPDDALRALAKWLRSHAEPPPAVLGPQDAAESFGKLWSPHARTGMRMNIWELRELVWPERCAPGRMRCAEERDIPLVAEWLAAFGRDTGLPVTDPVEHARDRIGRGFLWLWETDTVVSLAGRVGRTPHGDRIGYVYTPDALRGRSYASTLVAHLSRQVLDEGLDFCFLYTDVTNPTSNAIYARLGYQPIATAVDVLFDASVA